MKQVLKEYILNTFNYDFIWEQIAKNIINKTAKNFMNFVKVKGNKLLEVDITYLEVDIERNTRILLFCKILKIYKNKIIVLLYPVAATFSSLY